jgi:hypothetical protein
MSAGTLGVRWTVRPVCAVSSTRAANARAARLRAGYSRRSDSALGAEVFDAASLGLAEPGRHPARITGDTEATVLMALCGCPNPITINHIGPGNPTPTTIFARHHHHHTREPETYQVRGCNTTALRAR